MGYKLVLVVRRDLNMGVGKIAAQCSHAAVSAYQKSGKYMLFRWYLNGYKKVVLSCPDEQAMNNIKKQASDLRLLTTLVRDAGLTEVEPNSTTVLAVGPGNEEVVDQVTRHLKLLK